MPSSCVDLNSDFRSRILRSAYKRFPFNIKGDLSASLTCSSDVLLSCCICAAYRSKEMDDILGDLLLQDAAKGCFEVVIVNDGGGEPIRHIVEQYKTRMKIVYEERTSSGGKIGGVRNRTMELAKGKYLLLLDDDTRIIQNDFISGIISVFEKERSDVVIPRGMGLFGMVKERYDYLEPFSFGAAGCGYTREIMLKVGGFHKDLMAYEDIDLAIRMAMIDVKVVRVEGLVFFHPPFYFKSSNKPLAMGQAVISLRRYYPPFIWIGIVVNALRFLPYGFSSDIRLRQWFQISWGVLRALFLRKKVEYL